MPPSVTLTNPPPSPAPASPVMHALEAVQAPLRVPCGECEDGEGVEGVFITRYERTWVSTPCRLCRPNKVGDAAVHHVPSGCTPPRPYPSSFPQTSLLLAPLNSCAPPPPLMDLTCSTAPSMTSRSSASCGCAACSSEGQGWGWVGGGSGGGAEGAVGWGVREEAGEAA